MITRERPPPAKSTIKKMIRTVNGYPVEEIVEEIPEPQTYSTTQIFEHRHSPYIKKHKAHYRDTEEIIDADNRQTIIYQRPPADPPIYHPNQVVTQV